MNPIPKAPRLYPVLSDIESTTGTEESEHDNYTANVQSDNRHHNNDSDDYDDEDRWAKLFECILFCFCIE